MSCEATRAYIRGPADVVLYSLSRGAPGRAAPCVIPDFPAAAAAAPEVSCCDRAAAAPVPAHCAPVLRFTSPCPADRHGAAEVSESPDVRVDRAGAGGGASLSDDILPRGTCR